MGYAESKNEYYKEMRREAKKEVAKAKNNAYDELYEELDSKEGERHCTDWRDRDMRRAYCEYGRNTTRE